jgi:hypothetical protein
VPERGGSRSGTFFMAKDKTSFILYCDQKGLFDKLPDEVAGRLIKHIFAYVNDEHPESEDLLLTIAFESIKTQLKRDLKKYEKYIEKQKVNGALGGRPRKTQDNPEVNSETQKTQAFFSKPKKADNVNDNDNDNVNDIIVVSTTEKKKTFKNWTKDEFIEDLKQFSEEYPKDTLNAFFLYWSESSASGKMRFQLEKTWESARRLIRWKESNPVAKTALKTETTKAPAPITPKFLQEQNEAS